MTRNQSGLSLSQIIITIGVLGTSSTVSANYLVDVLPAARDAQRQANVRQVQTALNLYYDDNLSYPVSNSSQATVKGWQIVKQTLENSQPWPYMPEVPEDPLNQDKYQFKYWSNGQIFQIIYETEDNQDKSPQISWGL